jgi:3'-5' exonuclease
MIDLPSLRGVLFLDIETVPHHSHFNQLDPHWQELWAEKSKYLRESRGLDLVASYSHAGIFAEFGKVICIAVAHVSEEPGMERVVRHRVFADHDEHTLLHNFATWLQRHTRRPFTHLCAHNGKEFDFPYLCRRMLAHGIALPTLLRIAGKKPWEVPHFDTLELWKCGDYKHYISLQLLCAVLGIPDSKDDISGADIYKVYYTENNLQRIAHYCTKDAVVVAQVFLRLLGEAPALTEPLPFRIQPNQNMQAAEPGTPWESHARVGDV